MKGDEARPVKGIDDARPLLTLAFFWPGGKKKLELVAEFGGEHVAIIRYDVMSGLPANAGVTTIDELAKMIRERK